MKSHPILNEAINYSLK